jgi:Arc/MetJ-type ribon-helix-helix transcriptional regulator
MFIGVFLMSNIVPIAPRSKVPESEKVTINLGFVDLGHIDLLVSEGFYANRTDFIRTAIRNQLSTHSDAVKQVVARKMLVLGLQHFSAADLRAVQAASQTLQIRVLGLATIADDVTPELALATIASLEVLGALHASPAVKAALASRQR